MSRFFERRFPEVDETVLVYVDRIEEFGAYVNLPAFGNVEALVQLSELSSRRIRSVNQIIHVGKEDVMVVLRVDPEKGFIDLSKKRVAIEDVEKCKEIFSKLKVVNDILLRSSKRSGIPIEEIYGTVGYPEGVESQITDRSLVIPNAEELSAIILEETEHRMKKEIQTYRTDIILTCYGSDGIDAIKTAIKAGLVMGAVSIKLIASPVYSVTSYEGIGIIDEAIKRMEETIQTFDQGMLKRLVYAVDDSKELDPESNIWDL